MSRRVQQILLALAESRLSLTVAGLLVPVLTESNVDKLFWMVRGQRRFKEKFERWAPVLGVQDPLLDMAEIMERAMDMALDQKDVKRKLAQRLQRKPRRARSKDRAGEISRYVPTRTRERVHQRAGYQCEYRAEDGTRCRSRTGLDIEHLRPLALYRNHDEMFLRLFCRAYNRLSAEKVFGAAFIQRKIEASRQDSS